MSRHVPRQPDRDRPHDPTPTTVHPHTHNLITHPSHPQPHPPHLNGATPIPPSSTNGPSALVSPSAVPAAPNGASTAPSIIHKLNAANEQTWLLIGRVAEQMGDLEHALSAYENALRHNPMSLSGLTQVAGIARIKENYPKAVDYFQRVLGLQEENGEVWSALGHCYLMQDDLQKAYSAYQQALYLLPNPKEDPKLWYGIGILYDRYGSLDHAEEAFSSVLRMDGELDFDKSNEILFRLGIIYKQQGKYDESLACFDRILRSPPSPLAHADIWFQIGHVYEQQKDHVRAKDAYERVVADNPGHAKVLQQLGWLYHQDGSTFQNQDLAIQYLTKSLEADPSDAQSWYLLGRAYMAGQKYNKAYEAYQQAVYRDGRNPTFWCSIGVLYFQINQFRDALDAYSRAIRINPYISEVWFDLGSLYESCNNQISDAIDAYARACELDPSNPAISQRLQLLKTAQATGGQLPAAPGPQDVHPTAYASAVVPPHGLTAPLLLQSSNSRPVFRTDSRGPSNEISLPPPSQVGAGRSSPGPFRGGPPPPVILDESRHVPSHTPLAPMDVDRSHARDYPPSRGGPLGHQTRVEELRNDHPHQQDPYFSRNQRPSSRSPSPPTLQHVHNPGRGRSPPPPPPPFQIYPSRQAVGPAQPSAVPSQRSPRFHPPPRHEPNRSVEVDGGWERRPPAAEHREWEKEPDQYPPTPHNSHPAPPFYPPRSPAHRAHSPPEPSPRSHPARYWETKGPIAPPPPPVHSSHSRPSPAPAVHHETQQPRRYDPQPRADRSYAGSPEGLLGSNPRGSESPRSASLTEPKERRRRPAKEKEPEPPLPKRRVTTKRPREEHAGPSSTPRPGSPEPSPTSATPRPPSRMIDEDYDESGVTDALMNLSSYRSAPTADPSHSPTVSSGSRHSDPSPRPPASHRNSVSSTRSHVSPPIQSASLKRPLSPGPDDLSDNKRSRMDKRRVSSPSGGRGTPLPTQPASHSPEARQPIDPYPPSPPLPATLPPHPRPVGAGLASHGSSSAPIALPPITTLSPSSTAPSPTDRDDRMQVDESRSISPPSRSKQAEHGHSSSRSPPSSKHVPSPPSEKKDGP
ncbi:hypothetical protein BDZ94DRAFT_1292387 [Collybia nuda]|uniref:Cytochrome c-type biogenesis protein H TPR domain-containing protein n=1 Tax=Collybia nuda TaxID=64659 RepID=A0A9P5XXF7_9AGAR|nr:hypothetical protein BDZ94DRAFT_1292387 [Collybia nuda]